MTSIDQWVHHWSRSRPSAHALAMPDAVLSYQELHGRVCGAAVVLADHGVGSGDRVAVLAGDGPIIVELLFACARLGAVLVPLNTRLTAAELGRIIDDAGPRLAVSDSERSGLLGEALAASVSTPIDVVEVQTSHGFDGASDHSAPERTGELHQTLLLGYTSGTTGMPKGVMLTQEAFDSNATNVAAMMDLTSQDRVLNVMPQFHIGGLNVHTTPTLRAGGVVVQHRTFEPAAALAELSGACSLGTLVPAMLTAVIALEAWPEVEFKTLRALNTGASPVPEALIRAVHAKGVPVTQLYGLTETGPLVLALRAEHARSKVGSCGLPGINVEVKLVDDADHEMANGPGEVLVRSSSVASGYWNNQAETDANFSSDGWFRTGDVATRDTDGFFFITDRKRDVIISGGENIFPAELEQVLTTIEGLREAVVIAAPSDRWGETPIVVAVKEPASEVDENDILRAFEGVVARYKRPSSVRWVDRLPRTAMGKVQKHLL